MKRCATFWKNFHSKFSQPKKRLRLTQPSNTNNAIKLTLKLTWNASPGEYILQSSANSNDNELDNLLLEEALQLVGINDLNVSIEREPQQIKFGDEVDFSFPKCFNLNKRKFENFSGFRILILLFKLEQRGNKIKILEPSFISNVLT